MERLRMQSLDVTSSNIDKIARLFPQCVTEHKDKDGKTVLGIDFEKLRDELSSDVIDDGEERDFACPFFQFGRFVGYFPTSLDFCGKR